MNHDFQKTMDLKIVQEEQYDEYGDGGETSTLTQKSVCSICGEAMWQEIETEYVRVGK